MLEEAQLITEDILLSAICNEFGCGSSDVNILNYECTAGSNKGDNFTCVMVAVKVKAKVKEKTLEDLNYMVKCVPPNEYRLEWIESTKSVSRECTVYGSIVPKLNQLRSDAKLKPLQIPQCFFASSQQRIVVMENLKKQGFTMLKFADIEDEHVRTVLIALAHFHATTFHFIKSFGYHQFIRDYPDLSLKGWINETQEESNRETEQLLGPVVGTCIDLVKNCCSKEEIEKFVPKLEIFEPLRRLQILDAFEPRESFKVLIHNDLWRNNLLFKSKNEVKFVDLQLVKLSRPAIDLVYFLCSSTSAEYRKTHFDNLIRLYHDALTSELKMMGYEEDPYPFEQLIEDYNICFPFGLVTGFFHAQSRLVPFDGSDGFDIDGWTSDEANTKMRKRMNETLIRKAKENREELANIVGLLHEAVERKVL